MTTSTETSTFPSTLELAKIFFESMNPTFKTPGDTMPKGSLWPHKLRRKYIHSVGVHGKVKFVSTGTHPYTGIFKGADHGIIRLSSAAEPVVGGQPLAPGMGLKFLRDGEDSANLVAMYSVNGTPDDWNFFSKDFFNHIGSASGAALNALAAKFATETRYVQEVGLSDMSQIDQTGLTESSSTFPFSLRFAPHKDVDSLFPTDLPGSDPMAYVSQLESVPANSRLYDVYATSKPTELGGTEALIGTLVLDGTMTRSKWGDENLLIRHQKMNDDEKIHEEWDPYLEKYSFLKKGSEGQKGWGCPFLNNVMQ